VPFNLGICDIQIAGDLLFDLRSVSPLRTSNSRDVSFSASAFVDTSSTAVMKQMGAYCSPIAISLTALTSDLAGNDLCTNPAAPAASASCTIWGLVLSRLRSGLSIHLGSLSFEGQGAFAT
jgi:hypothetical protein